MTRNSNNANANSVGRGSPAADTGGLRARLERAALAAGIDAFGICSAELMNPERERFLAWLGDGRAGRMEWLTPDWARRATDASSFLPGARSVVCLALSYASAPAGPSPTGHGRIARYANGEDYHQLIGDSLRALERVIADFGGTCRAFVDSAPTMDKAFAVRAGLGWIGKNTNVLNRKLGSFLLLGGLVTDMDLAPDEPVADSCGTCRLCVLACPTGALKGDYTMDARLCISYLTIEHRDPIPRELRAKIGDWIFGCDICQDVCPVVTDRQDREYAASKDSRIAFVRGTLTGRRDAL